MLRSGQHQWVCSTHGLPEVQRPQQSSRCECSTPGCLSLDRKSCWVSCHTCCDRSSWHISKLSTYVRHTGKKSCSEDLIVGKSTYIKPMAHEIEKNWPKHKAHKCEWTTQKSTGAHWAHRLSLIKHTSYALPLDHLWEFRDCPDQSVTLSWRKSTDKVWSKYDEFHNVLHLLRIASCICSHFCIKKRAMAVSRWFLFTRKALTLQSLGVR